MQSKVNIVVPVYNGERTLSSCLDSLINLDFPKENLEIIVVDNNSTDRTRDIIKDYPVRYVFEQKRSRAAARNRGIRESRGDLIAFIDVDCIAQTSWLINLIGGFSDSRVGGCGGEFRSLHTQSLIHKYFDMRLLGPQEKGLANQGLLLPRINTRNAVYRRRVLEDVGLFDDNLVNNEDSDLSLRIGLEGYKLNYVPEAVVYHRNPDRLIDCIKKWFEIGYTHYYLLNKYSNLLKSSLFEDADGVNFLVHLFEHIKDFFTSLFTDRHIHRKLIPLLLFLEGIFMFLGRLYGLMRIRLGIQQAHPLPFQHGQIFWREFNEEVIITKARGDFYYTLNNVGSRVWMLHIQGKNIPEIIDIIADEFGIDKQIAREDIDQLMDELRKESLFLNNSRFINQIL